MAEQAEEDLMAEETPGFKAPAEKPLKDLVSTDQEDESLRKYKETLLGTAAANPEDVIFFPEDPRRVIVKKLALLVEGRPDVVLDLAENSETLKKQKVVIKEGGKYRVQVFFHVQREIVAGLKYIQKLYKMSVPVGKEKYMVGSYGPKAELQSYITAEEEAPSGMLTRGHYTVKSLFTDDDSNKHLEWEWAFDIKKEWD